MIFIVIHVISFSLSVKQNGASTGHGTGQREAGVSVPCALPQLLSCEGGKQCWKTECPAVPTRAHQFWKPDLRGIVGLRQKFLHCSKESLSKPNLLH